MNDQGVAMHDRASKRQPPLLATAGPDRVITNAGRALSTDSLKHPCRLRVWPGKLLLT